MSQAEINTFCRATTAVYFAILRAHAERSGAPVRIPDLLCPQEGRLPRADEYDSDTIDAAEEFLLRMGFLGVG